jgi:hypothetical protein
MKAQDSNSIERLFADFVRAYEHGQPIDVQSVLGRAEGPDREALADRIEDFVASAGRRPFNEKAFSASPLRAKIERALRER